MGLFSLLFLVLEECIETFLKGFPGSGIAFRRICEFFGGVEEVHKILAMLSVLDFLVELLTQVNAMVFWSPLLRGGLSQAMLSNLLRGGLGLKVDSGGGKGGECANNRFVHFDNSLLSFAGFKLYKSPDLMSKRDGRITLTNTPNFKSHTN